MDGCEKRIILKEKEEAIIDAITFLFTKKGIARVVEYDFEKAQEYLDNARTSVKFILTPEEQLSILQRLADDNIIDMDYIIPVGLTNTIRSIGLSNTPLIETDEEYIWAKHKDWSYEILQYGGERSLEEVYENSKTGIFINITKERIQDINAKYRLNHTVHLELNKEYSCLRIRFDNEKKWTSFTALDKKKAPYKILEYAYKKSPETVKAETLYEEGIITEKQKKEYWKTRLFSDNKVVQALHPLLIYLDKHEMTFRKCLRVTPAEYQKLRSELKIS